ncbi:MAG TPA: HAMP domain-containing sensor histidine kinase [Anaerolineae bacterium]|nr:HAMP domain-containing sensor histidine kinase [Anaerolineae bacterium]
MSLRTQLILSHTLPLLVLIPVLGVLLLYIIETQVLLDNLAEDLASEASVLATIASQQRAVFLDKGTAEFFARAAGEQYDHNVALFQGDGLEWMVLVGQNAPDPPQPTKAELAALEQGKVQKRIVFSLIPSQEDAEALAPVLNAQQRLVGIVRVTEHVDRLNARLTEMRLLILGATFLALLVAIFIGALLATREAQRLNAVTAAVTQVAEGRAPPTNVQKMPREFRPTFTAVNDLQERLRESEQARKRLLANLVHELGRPLAALQAAIHALQQGAVQDTALRQELLQGMDAQVERLKPLLDNLASLHGELSGAFDLHRAPVDLNEWLPKAMITWRHAAEAKKIYWNEAIAPNLPKVNMDADRMAQVIGNLLSNAIKYTPEGGMVTLSAGQRNHEVWIAVEDNGIGIPPEEQAHIFDPLFRGSLAQSGGTNRFPQGMGLGLAIARDLVIAHGGGIEVESEVGKGSRFVVTLPVS